MSAINARFFCMAHFPVRHEAPPRREGAPGRDSQGHEGGTRGRDTRPPLRGAPGVLAPVSTQETIASSRRTAYGIAQGITQAPRAKAKAGQCPRAVRAALARWGQSSTRCSVRERAIFLRASAAPPLQARARGHGAVVRASGFAARGRAWPRWLSGARARPRRRWRM